MAAHAKPIATRGDKSGVPNCPYFMSMCSKGSDTRTSTGISTAATTTERVELLGTKLRRTKAARPNPSAGTAMPMPR